LDLANCFLPYLHDGFRKSIATTGTFYDPHRYGGKYGHHSNLNAAGFILAGQRWYSPHLRRWISRDPIGYEGDDNLYDYVGQSPTTKVDPDGLSPLPALAGGSPYIGGGAAIVGPVAGSAAGIAGVTFAAAGSLYCIFYPDECLAAYQGYCASTHPGAELYDPNIYNRDERKRIHYPPYFPQRPCAASPEVFDRQYANRTE
jgi:RHS repeat-associated protein